MESGGLPELFNLQNDEIKRNYVSAIKDTVFLRDIIQRYNIKEPKLLEDIFVFLVNNAANLISITSIVNYFKSLGRKPLTTPFPLISVIWKTHFWCINRTVTTFAEKTRFREMRNIISTIWHTKIIYTQDLAMALVINWKILCTLTHNCPKLIEK